MSNKTGPKPGKPPRAPRPSTADVLTLGEVSAYLRWSEADVLRAIREQGLPARRAGEDAWRFLRAAVQDWLRTPPLAGSREAVLSAAGAWKDDPNLARELEEIYQRRGRSTTGNGA